MDDAATGTVSTDTLNLGAAWKLGAFTIRGGYSTTEIDVPTSSIETTYFG
jgi:hypothetical protein